VREYLSAVLPGLENFPANRVNELTPAAWMEHAKGVSAVIHGAALA
jgi:hypothetical protein